MSTAQRYWSTFYNLLVVPLLWTIIYVAAVFKSKVRRGIRGRRNLFRSLATQVSRLTSSSKRVWFHSSSLGEFEQAKPIISELKRRRPDIVVMVSFFSPSGYDHSKNYRLADIITYIPFDSRRNANQLVATLKPDAAVMVRYDIWPNHIWTLKQAGIPILLANATMRPHSSRHLPVVKSFHQSVYNVFDSILTVSERDVEAFKQFHLSSSKLETIGDTRYDQVWQRSIEAKSRHILPPGLTANRRIIVIGSSWDSDEEVLLPALTKLFTAHPRLLTILVPHEPTLETIERLERECNGRLTSIRFSDLHDYKNQNVIIIDSVGILMALYQYADVAYVGGSFKQGIHNVLEPAVYGCPVLFGPEHQNSQEAIELVREGAAFVANSEDGLYDRFHALLTNEPLRQLAGIRARAFVERNTGATGRFLSYLEKVL